MNVRTEPLGGVGVRNRKGDVVFWVRDKHPPGSPPFVLLLYRRHEADEDQRKVFDSCYEGLIEMSQDDGVPVYDSDEINREIARFFKELGDASGSKTPEYVNIRVTDLVRKKQDMLTIRVTCPSNTSEIVPAI
jgi:hypothetical protein